MYRLTCPKCGADSEEARLTVISGKFESTNMLLCEDGFSVVDARQFNTEDEMVWCKVCERTFPLSDCEAIRPEPSFAPFKGFDWTELAARLGVNIRDDQDEDADKLRAWLREHCQRELDWVAANCREFLAALIKADPCGSKPVWMGLAEVKDDKEFMEFFIRLLDWMWT